MKCKKVIFWGLALGSVIATGIGLTNSISLFCGLGGGVLTIVYGCFLNCQEVKENKKLQESSLELMKVNTELESDDRVQKQVELESSLEPGSKVLAYAFESQNKATIFVEEPGRKPGIDKPGIFMKTVVWNRVVR